MLTLFLLRHKSKTSTASDRSPTRRRLPRTKVTIHASYTFNRRSGQQGHVSHRTYRAAPRRMVNGKNRAPTKLGQSRLKRESRYNTRQERTETLRVALRKETTASRTRTFVHLHFPSRAIAVESQNRLTRLL